MSLSMTMSMFAMHRTITTYLKLFEEEWDLSFFIIFAKKIGNNFRTCFNLWRGL